MTKITIERETLERAVDILDRRLNWNPVVDKLCSEINAALATQPVSNQLSGNPGQLAAQPADAQQEPVARVNADGFIVETGLLIAAGTLLYAAPPAPAAVPLTDEQRNDCIEAWSSQGWGDRLGEVVRICIAIERAHGIAAGSGP